MEDFIVISDDSGSESSAGTRSGRARRLRRALSRTPGALPRRTVAASSQCQDSGVGLETAHLCHGGRGTNSAWTSSLSTLRSANPGR
uniref:SUMO-interacting motifs containing 1 n=1 Tax=Mus musculus TaxID=10090 RepID=E0CY56_MOUSE